MAIADPPIAVRRAVREDVAGLARLHAAGLPDGFFARLGPAFLAVYLRTFLDGPDGVALVARDGDEVIGFVVGATRARRHSRWMVRRRGLRLAWRAMLAMLARPAVLLTFLRTRLGRYVRGLLKRLVPRSVAGSAQGSGEDLAVLLHVVVDGDARGRGIGGMLVERFVDELRDRGVSEVRLVTDADEGAGALYRRLGWTRLGNRRRDDVVLAEYAYVVGPDWP